MTIQEILEAHIQSIRNGRCSCEDRGPKRTELEHRAHVAEVLDKHMQERILSWQEHAYLLGYAQANEDIENGAEYPTPNPYKEEK